jgi:hypothetical protein
MVAAGAYPLAANKVNNTDITLHGFINSVVDSH